MLKKFCRKQGCRKVTADNYCDDHKMTKQQYEMDRGTAAERGYDHKWRKARQAFLHKHPLCIHCLEIGRAEAATVVDHKIPHKGNQRLFWDKDNWQPLCASHHSIKTVKEDGGFGNEVRGRGVKISKKF